MPITGLDDCSIFNAYKKNFEELAAKGIKPKLNVLDNQATKHIKSFPTEEDCKLQLVKPHNHRVNAAECAIQTFKDAFILALAMMDKVSNGGGRVRFLCSKNEKKEIMIFKHA